MTSLLARTARGLSKVTTTYNEDAAASRTFGGTLARAFSGTVTIWDTRDLNSRLRV